MVVWPPTRAIGRSEDTTIVDEPRYRKQQPGMNEIAPRLHTSKVIFKNPYAIAGSSSKATAAKSTDCVLCQALGLIP